MKYCPYCGAVLLDGTVSFCSECGKALSGKPAQPQTEVQTAASAESEDSDLPEKTPDPAAATEDVKTVEQPVSQKKSANRKKKYKKTAKKAKSVKKSSTQDQQPVDEKTEEDYDGYYNDILPVDEGHLREGMDKNLIQKIIVLTVSALLIVGACVAIMYLL